MKRRLEGRSRKSEKHKKKKKSLQSKNRQHQEKLAHRRKQIQSGTSLDRHHRMYCAGIPKEQSPAVKVAIEERLAKGV